MSLIAKYPVRTLRKIDDSSLTTGLISCSCPGVMLAKRHIIRNAVPGCVGGGVVEHVTRNDSIWISVQGQVLMRVTYLDTD